MTATTSSPPDAATGGPLLLPPAPPRLGPESRRLLGRLAVSLLMWQVVAAALLVVGGETATAAGVSMVFPGAGLLYVASPLLFLGSLVALLVALVLWWGVSAHVAIPIVWAGAGVVAVALVDGPRWFVDRGTTWGWAVPVAYAMAVGTVGFMVWRVESAYRRKLAKVPELNEYLLGAQLPERLTERRELDDMDAELLTWAYAFAFQPEDGLDGLDWGEQFHGGTQLRYQLNSLTWAMSLYAANHLPNAPAQITKALETMVRKHTDLRVWKYWRTLNLVGNFDSNPDPIRRDNIMFSAFLGDVINSVEAATGTDTFDKPGSLEFVWLDGRTFSYDHHTLGGRGAAQLRAEPARVLPVRAGLVVHGVQRDGRAGVARSRRGPRHRHLAEGARPVDAHARPRVPHPRRVVRPHPLQPRRPVVGHRRGAGRPLLRERHAPVRRHPPRPCASGPGARTARCGAEDGGAVGDGARRAARPRPARRTRASSHAPQHAAPLDQDHRRRPTRRRRPPRRRRDPVVGREVRDRESSGRIVRSTAVPRRRVPTCCCAGRPRSIWRR